MNLYDFFKRMLKNPMYEYNQPIPLTISDGVNTLEVVIYARDLDVHNEAQVVIEGCIYTKDECFKRREPKKCV